MHFLARAHALEVEAHRPGRRPVPPTCPNGIAHPVHRSALPRRRPELSNYYDRFSLKDVDLGFAGRHFSIDPINRNIKTLSPADALALKLNEDRWHLLDSFGSIVGHLAKSFSPPKGMILISAHVNAIVHREREDALAAAATCKHIYVVNFTEPSSAMSAPHAGADPARALELLVITSLTVANTSAAARTADYLLCCCVPADVPRIREMISRFNPTTNSLALLDIENSVLFRMQFWLDGIQKASAEFCDRIVNACKNQDKTALQYWIKKGILITQPPGLRFAGDGYECEFDDIETVSEIAIVPDANTIPQFFGGEPDTIPSDCGVGPHALAKSGDDDGEIVVYIKRPN